MKKGFTLIELLGVLAILGILAIITVPIIQGLLESGEEDSKEMQIASFEKAAKSWAGNNVFAMPAAKSQEKKIICLKDLIDKGYLDALKDEGGYYIKVNGRDDSEFNLEKTCFTIINDGTSDKAHYQYKYKGYIINEDGTETEDTKSTE